MFCLRCLIICYVLTFFSFSAHAQVGIGTISPSEKATLEISSRVDGAGDYRGFLPPRVPSNIERDAIAPSVSDKGLMVFVNSSKCIEIWNGYSWVKVKCGEDLPYASDLFFSEYVEGTTGNNKALEIANYTGGAINLSNYAIIGYNNGSTSSTYNHPLPNHSLAHGKTYLVVHNGSNVDATLIAKSNTRLNIDFNGNDAVVLSKSSVVIDILGEIGNDWSFGTDVILRKKPGYGPSAVYIPAQFDLDVPNNYSDLGTHNFYE